MVNAYANSDELDQPAEDIPKLIFSQTNASLLNSCSEDSVHTLQTSWLICAFSVCTLILFLLM